MSKPLIIGFSGRARHGKTVCCEAIVRRMQQAGYTAKMYDIGNMIRLECIDTGRLPRIERADMDKEQLQILINVGKEKRAVDVDYWIRQMFQAIAVDAPDVAVCPNLRYENEAAACRAAGGYVVRLTRLNENGSVFISDDRPANDISETALEFWPADFYLTTKPGQLDLLEEQSWTLLRYLYMKER